MVSYPCASKGNQLLIRSIAAYYDPDRWLDERLNKYFTANPFIFLPFNAGPRICLGQQVRTNALWFLHRYGS